MVSAEGPVGSYAKRKLVPWGEYIPLKDVLPFMGKVARAAGDFTPGSDLGLMPWGDERLAPAICYEVIFGSAVAEQVRAGATLLVTITNDAWYGDTWAPFQHFRAARFRAAENRRPLIRAALTGISGLIDRRGHVTGRLGVGERGVLRGRIAGSQDLSPYSREPMGGAGVERCCWRSSRWFEPGDGRSETGASRWDWDCPPYRRGPFPAPGSHRLASGLDVFETSVALCPASSSGSCVLDPLRPASGSGPLALSPWPHLLQLKLVPLPRWRLRGSRL